MALTKVSGGVLQQPIDVGIVTASNGTFSGNLNVAGVSTFQGNVDLGDNDRLRFGASQDLQIWHDSTSGKSHIKESGPGLLQVDTNNFSIRNSQDTEQLAYFTENAGVGLYYNNSKKFETTGFGVTVYDTVQAPQLNITGVSTFANTINAVDASFSGNVSVAGTLTYEDVTNIDSIGIITARSGIHVTGGDITLNKSRSVTHASLIIDKPDAGSGTLKFYNNGSDSGYIQHTNAEHLHYYLPSGSGYHAFYTNGNNERLRITSTGNIGIGTDNPAAELEVYGNGRFKDADGSHGIELYPDVSGLGYQRIISYNRTTSAYENLSIGVNDFIVTNGSTSESLRITSGGDVGIGTTNPDKKLRVEGDARITGTLTMGTASIEIAGDSDFPTIRPTLDLNFAATKTLDRRITFTRDSIGTYIDELGVLKYAPNNTPRFDHDPDTGESLGLLIEESRTNLIAHSNFSSNWSLYSSTLVSDSSIISPDGGTSAYKIVEDSSLGVFHFISYGLTMGSEPYTISVWLKAAERTEGSIFITQGGNNGARFNLSNGTIISVFGNGNTASIKDYGNGWYRCSVTNNGSSDVENSIRIGPNGGAVSAYDGDGSSGIHVWGPQVEAGSFPTSYIPTSGSTVTRAADLAKITGTNFTGFYNTLEGTLYSSFIRKPASNKFIVGLGYDSSNYIAMGYTVDSSTNDMYIQPLISSLNGLPSVGGNVRSKSIISYNSSGASGSINGNSVVSETASGGLPSGSNGALYIGTSAYDPPVICTGTISSVVYYNKRLTNSQLQSLTRQ